MTTTENAGSFSQTKSLGIYLFEMTTIENMIYNINITFLGYLPA